MAMRGIRYIVKRARQIAILSIGMAIFIALCFQSMGVAKTGVEDAVNEPERAALPTKVMKILMAPAGSPIDACLTEDDIPAPDECQPFFKIDEDVLENLIQNYTECLDGHSFFYDFSNQPTIKLTKTLKIYGRTDELLTIKGLKLSPSESFPKGHPAIVVYGKPVEIKDISLDGFKNGIIYLSKDNEKNRLIGGEMNGAGKEGLAIISCHDSPKIEGTVISGFQEKLSVIK